MSLQCFPSSFGSIFLPFGSRYGLRIFKTASIDGWPGSHLGYRNETILANLNVNVFLVPPIKFQLNPTYRSGDVVGRISRWLPWQDGCHEYRNKTILAILNVHVSSMLPTNFQLNPTYRSRRDNDRRRTYGRAYDGRTTDNRPWHKLI